MKLTVAGKGCDSMTEVDGDGGLEVDGVVDESKYLKYSFSLTVVVVAGVIVACGLEIDEIFDGKRYLKYALSL